MICQGLVDAWAQALGKTPAGFASQRWKNPGCQGRKQILQGLQHEACWALQLFLPTVQSLLRFPFSFSHASNSRHSIWLSFFVQCLLQWQPGKSTHKQECGTHLRLWYS